MGRTPPASARALPAAPSDADPTAAPLWPIWSVTLTSGAYTSTCDYTAPTRSQARYQAWLTVSDAWELSFAQFQRLTTIRRRSDPPPSDGYDYVRRNYGVDARIGRRVRVQNEGPGYNGREGVIVFPNKASTAYVHVLLDGDKRPSVMHPMSVVLTGEAPFSPAQRQARPTPLAPEIPF